MITRIVVGNPPQIIAATVQLKIQLASLITNLIKLLMGIVVSESGITMVIVITRYVRGLI